MRALLLSLLCVPLLAAAGPGELTPYKGAPLQPFNLKSLDGAQLALENYRGKVVLVNFWASWCPPCVEEMPSMQALKDDLRQEPFEILAINLGEDEATIREFLTQIELDFPILMDPEGRVVESWKVFAFPTSFLVDPQGQVRYSLFGAYAWDAPAAVAQVRSLMP